MAHRPSGCSVRSSYAWVTLSLQIPRHVSRASWTLSSMILSIAEYWRWSTLSTSKRDCLEGNRHYQRRVARETDALSALFASNFEPLRPPESLDLGKR